MLLKVINLIKDGDGYHQPGDIFTIDDVDATRLIKLGVAIPLRKKVTLSFSLKNPSDDLASDLMDEKSRDDSGKTIIDADCQKGAIKSDVSHSENTGSEQEVGDGFLSSLNDRVQAESGNVVNHAENQPVFTPKCRATISENNVKRFAQTEANKQGGLIPDHKNLGNQ